MNLLIISQYFQPEVGATQSRLAATTQELVRAGHSVEILTAMPNYPIGRTFPEYRWSFYRQEAFGTTRVHRVWSYPSQGAGLGRMLNYGTFAMTSIFGLTTVRKPDCVFVEVPPLSLCVPAILASKLWRVPVIINVADLWPDSAIELGLLDKEGPFAAMLWRLEGWAYRQADYVCAVTEDILETLGSQKDVPERKLLFLPNGVDTELYTSQPPDISLRKQLGLEGKKLVVYAGTLGLVHGLDKLLNAAEVLRNEPEFHFLFVGSGSAKQILVARAQASGLPNVSFVDPVPAADVPKYYSIALCGAVSLSDLPLFQSAKPAKTLAIMACGKPVVLASNCATSLIIDANAGIVADDPNSIANAIRRLGNDPKLAAEFGANGRAYVERHWTWPLLVGRWLRQLEAGADAKSELHKSLNSISAARALVRQS